LLRRLFAPCLRLLLGEEKVKEDEDEEEEQKVGAVCWMIACCPLICLPFATVVNLTSSIIYHPPNSHLLRGSDIDLFRANGTSSHSTTLLTRFAGIFFHVCISVHTLPRADPSTRSDLLV
jgi:hypothetical protein